MIDNFYDYIIDFINKAIIYIGCVIVLVCVVPFIHYCKSKQNNECDDQNLADGELLQNNALALVAFGHSDCDDEGEEGVDLNGLNSSYIVLDNV